MKMNLRPTISMALVLALLGGINPAMAQSQPWVRRYNPGTDPRTAIGREFLDLYARIPDMGAISQQLTGDQKFRVPDGVILGRTLYGINEVKAIAVGQDGTHGAKFSEESAAGASFGGVAQHYLEWFGVGRSAAFTNDFLTTIYGQYGTNNTPYVVIDPVTKKRTVRFAKIVDNGTWAFANDPQSPIAKFRNDEFDLRLRQNPDSLQLIALFGGAAADGWGAYIESLGGEVGSQYSDEDLSRIRTVICDIKSAGGNNEFAVPLDKNGKDIYEILVGRKLNYTDLNEQQIAMKALAAAGDRGIDMMVTTGGGIHGSGLIHRAQINGFHMDEVKINGVVTDSLKGLPLSNGKTVARDIYFAHLPHPTALGMMKDRAARDRLIAQKTERLREHQKNGWRITPDAGLENLFDQGKPLDYGKSPLPAEHFEYGIAAFRRGSSTDAARLGPNVVVSGKVTSRDAPFNKAEIDQALKAMPSSLPPNSENYLTRASGEERYIFDPGPSERFERITLETFTPAFLKAIFAVKPGKSPAKDGINAYFTASSPELEAYAPYRGNLENSEVLILGDRVWGFDEVSNSRSLTGARGQVLHGLMQDMDVNKDKYVVLDTVPFNMTGKEPADWAAVLQPTMQYRERMIKEILRNGTVQLVLTDGAHAAAEARRILQKLNVSIPVVDIKGRAGDPFSGVQEAGEEMSRSLSRFHGKKANGKMLDIPRSHLPFWTDRYEGTGGDRIINSNTPLHMGRTLARVTPYWASGQKRQHSPADGGAVQALVAKLAQNNYRRMDEKVPDYIARMKKTNPSFDPSVGSSAPAILSPKNLMAVPIRCEAVFVRGA